MLATKEARAQELAPEMAHILRVLRWCVWYRSGQGHAKIDGARMDMLGEIQDILDYIDGKRPERP